MIPPGSSPGMISFAMAPAISPRTIHPRMPMPLLPSCALWISVIHLELPCTRIDIAVGKNDLDGPVAPVTLDTAAGQHGINRRPGS
jgi:hypothetical protein